MGNPNESHLPEVAPAAILGSYNPPPTLAQEAEEVVRAHDGSPTTTARLARYVADVSHDVGTVRGAVNGARDTDAGFALLLVKTPGPVLEAVVALLENEYPLRGEEPTVRIQPQTLAEVAAEYYAGVRS